MYCIFLAPGINAAGKQSDSGAQSPASTVQFLQKVKLWLKSAYRPVFVQKKRTTLLNSPRFHMYSNVVSVDSSVIIIFVLAIAVLKKDLNR